MKIKRSIQLKAAFLMLVFSLNTAIGFACAVGFDMGYNSNHHPDLTEAVHIHNGGNKHLHKHNKKSDQNNTHNHDKIQANQHSGNDGDKDCCGDQVTKFAQLEKAVPYSTKSPVNPLFFSPFISSYYNINSFALTQSFPQVRQFDRSYHPPIPDIRIAIQSFQI